MEKNLQYLLARREIEDKIILYAYLIDTKEFDRLDEVCTPDAYIDFRATGGANGNLEEIKAFLKTSMAKYSCTQHFMGDVKVDFSEDGMTARSITMLHNPMTRLKDGVPNTFYVGCWYNDDWVKTDKGWFIKSRIQSPGYFKT